jgi:hypothetical protein
LVKKRWQWHLLSLQNWRRIVCGSCVLLLGRSSWCAGASLLARSHLLGQEASSAGGSAGWCSNRNLQAHLCRKQFEVFSVIVIQGREFDPLGKSDPTCDSITERLLPLNCVRNNSLNHFTLSALDLSCFIHCNGSRLLVFIVEVRSRRHQPSSSKKIQLLSPNPNQLVGSNRKANSKECAHGEGCDSQSDDSYNFHDL